jgi:hypothetical protein
LEDHKSVNTTVTALANATDSSWDLSSDNALANALAFQLDCEWAILSAIESGLLLAFSSETLKETVWVNA